MAPPPPADPPAPRPVRGTTQATRTVCTAAQAAAQAAVQTVNLAVSCDTRHAISISAAAASAAAMTTTKLHAVVSGSGVGPSSSATARQSVDLAGCPATRKIRQSLSLDEKLKLISMKESGASRLGRIFEVVFRLTFLSRLSKPRGNSSRVSVGGRGRNWGRHGGCGGQPFRTSTENYGGGTTFSRGWEQILYHLRWRC